MKTQFTLKVEGSVVIIVFVNLNTELLNCFFVFFFGTDYPQG